MEAGIGAGCLKVESGILLTGWVTTGARNSRVGSKAVRYLHMYPLSLSSIRDHRNGIR